MNEEINEFVKKYGIDHDVEGIEMTEGDWNLFGDLMLQVDEEE